MGSKDFPPEDWIQEIPFDVSDWGDRDPQPPVHFKDRAAIEAKAKEAAEKLLPKWTKEER